MEEWTSAPKLWKLQIPHSNAPSVVKERQADSVSREVVGWHYPFPFPFPSILHVSAM